VPARSRGTSTLTSPAASVSTVLDRVPFGVAAVAALHGVLVVADVLAHLFPRKRGDPHSSADSSTVLVIAFNSPSGPVRATPRARADLTSSRAAANSCSAGETTFLISFGRLTPTSVSVVTDPFR